MRILAKKFLYSAAGNLRGGFVQLVDAILETIFGHGGGASIESVGFDDVSAGFEILSVYRGDDFRLREIQNVIAEAQVAGMAGKFGAAVAGFGEIARLNHRPHSAIENDDAGIEKRFQFRGAMGSSMQTSVTPANEIRPCLLIKE